MMRSGAYGDNTQMNEMAISYEAEDAEGIKYRMQGVHPVYYSDSSIPRLYLLTEDAKRLRMSIFSAGRMSAYREYPLRAKQIIIKSLESCKGLALLSALCESKKEQAKALN